jgi:dTDP-4-dehydrorhamnose 3,5-epimerase
MPEQRGTSQASLLSGPLLKAPPDAHMRYAMPPPVQLICPKRFVDSRGWFTETYNRTTFAGYGIDCAFAQDNHSFSTSTFILRGLHFQRPPRAQAKLVRCVRGRIFDVAVDLRRGSPTYGKWLATELSAENGHQIFIPAGFAHGFLTLEDNCEVVYKCSDTYEPEYDDGIVWNSAGIDWPLPAGVEPQLSDKDRRLSPLTAFDSPFAYDGRPLTPFA